MATAQWPVSSVTPAGLWPGLSCWFLFSVVTSGASSRFVTGTAGFPDLCNTDNVLRQQSPLFVPDLYNTDYEVSNHHSSFRICATQIMQSPLLGPDLCDTDNVVKQHDSLWICE